MSVLYNLTSFTAVKILWKFLERSTYNTGEVFIPAGERGCYKIDPLIHWKGDYKTREKLLNSGCTLTITPSLEFEEGKE